MYRLHGFSQSGHTFKVAFMLEALQEPWQPLFVDYLGGATRAPEWRVAVNEMGEVPVLDDGRRRFSQSGVILSYLASKHCAFGGESEEERLEILRWLFFDNHKFTSCFASYRYLKTFAPGTPDMGVMHWLRGRIDSAFGIVDQHLRDRPFLVGARPTIADISLCGYLYYPEEESGCQFVQRFPHIAAWLGRLRDVPGWAPPNEIFTDRSDGTVHRRASTLGRSNGSK